jgi:serine/threonine protein kinase
LPFVFGVNTTCKPYFVVLEFYGISGRCLTLAKASKKKVFATLSEWANILTQCCNALAHLHNKNYIHCDIKGDNIVIRHGYSDCEEQYSAVIIDFGKMKESSKAKLYKLSLKEQERYGKYHNHIAPEVVCGKQTQSAASDIYSFGQVISLVCHYNRYEELRKIAVQCINGTPSRRPTIDNLISQLNSLC